MASRDARPGDNEALLALTSACTMEAPVALCIDRSPDFFALNRLEGSAWRVGVVVDGGDRIVGCVAAAARSSYVNGQERRTTYASDLKVHPGSRRSGATDLLTHYVRSATTELAGPSSPCVITMMSGNRAMERRVRGPRGAPVLTKFASLAVTAIPLLWERRERVTGVRVRRAAASDLEEMAALWRIEATRRQFAAVLSAGDMAAWVASAPGLAISDYLVATDDTGRIRGFMGVWDQSSFKQTRVVRYSPRMALVRRAFNLAAPFAGARPLPDVGEPLPVLATVHVCAESPLVLRALLLDAYRTNRGRTAFITVGLDVSDPLAVATRGLLGQPTYVDAYVTTPRGRADPGMLDGRPLQFETALV
jgi:hypothetical protein